MDFLRQTIPKTVHLEKCRVFSANLVFRIRSQLGYNLAQKFVRRFILQDGFP